MAAVWKRDAALAAERMRAHVSSGRETLVAQLRSELSES